MALTPTQIQDWLNSDTARPCVLFEPTINILGIETDLFFSNRAYNFYKADLTGSLEYTEDMGVTNDANISFGNISILNPNGEYDSYFNAVWKNRSAIIALGDVSWPRTDFIEFHIVIDDISANGQDEILVKLRDKLQFLNTPLSEEVLGGTTANKDALYPVTLGECANVTPLLTNPVTLEYCYHPLSTQEIIEVRDNGIPVSFTPNLVNGKFTLLTKPVGQITCSVKGHNVGGYSVDVAGLIKHVVKDNGKASVAYTDADIDLTNFSAFASANPEKIGYYVTARDNILTVIQGIAASVGAKVCLSRDGKLRLFQIDAPSGTSTRTITAADMGQHSLAIDTKLPINCGVKLNYCKNWTVQKDLKSAITAMAKSIHSKEWMTVSANDATLATLNKDNVTPKEVDTYLIVKSEAQAEATRRVNFTKNPHYIYRFDGLQSCMNLELGQLVTMQHSRFGMGAGVLAQVVKLSFNWFTMSVQVWVLV